MALRISRLAVMLLLAVATASLGGVPSSADFRPFLKFVTNLKQEPAAFNKAANKVGKNIKDIVEFGYEIVKLVPPPPPPGPATPLPPQIDVGHIYRSPPAKQGAGLYTYTIDLAVGTPRAQSISGVLDISSQLVWTRCAPCTGGACPAPTFIPGGDSYSMFTCSSDVCQAALGNSTCAGGKEQSCGYVATYGGDAASTAGFLAADNFTFGDTAVPVVFGCSYNSAGEYADGPGVVGFSRGPLSLVSQLAVSNFSYYLAPKVFTGDSKIQVGDVAAPQTQTGRIRSTRLLKSSKDGDHLYYVNLTGIMVDGQKVTGIPPGTFDLRDDGSGGVFLSTTVPVTYLAEDAYDAVRRAFASRMMSMSSSAKPLSGDSKLKHGLDLCYTATSIAGVSIPKMTLVFEGADAAMMELEPSNYVVKIKDDGDTEEELACLAVLPSRDASLLGSLLQTGTTMIYDLDGEQLTFVREDTFSSVVPAAPTRAGARAWALHAHSASLIVTLVTVAAAWIILLF